MEIYEWAENFQHTDCEAIFIAAFARGSMQNLNQSQYNNN